MQEMQEMQVWSLGREDPPGEGNGNLLQYSCLENPVDRGAWRDSPWDCKESDTTEHSTQPWLLLLERNWGGVSSQASQPGVHAKWLSRVPLFATPWTVAHQAPLSMGFSRQEYWSGLPRPPPGNLPDPGIEPESLMSHALAGGLFTTSATWEAQSQTGAPTYFSIHVELRWVLSSATATPSLQSQQKPTGRISLTPTGAPGGQVGIRQEGLGLGLPGSVGKHPHKKKGALKRKFLMWEEHRDSWRGNERPLSETQHCPQLTLSHPTLYIYSGGS